MSAVTILLLVGGLVLLVAGAEVLVRGASHLAIALGISPLVVGLTVVAFGTSAPEMAVGVQAAAAGNTEVALGNVVGSNLFNTLAILGVAALIAPLVVHQKLVRREVPIMIGVSVLVLLFALNGSIGRVEGAILFAGVIAYTAWAVVVERREPPEVQAEYADDLGDAASAPRHWLVDLALVAGGLGLLVLGSRWLVDGAVDVAEALGLSQLIIGLTIVAAGTSLPEAATSVVAAVRGQRDIAVGNAVGSNLFNLLSVLGLSAMVAPDGIPAPDSAIRFDLPVLVGSAVLCVGAFYTRWTIERWEGAVFAGLYGGYLAHLVLEATESDALGPFRWAMVAVLAVVAVALVVASAREARAPVPG